MKLHLSHSQDMTEQNKKTLSLNEHQLEYRPKCTAKKKNPCITIKTQTRAKIKSQPLKLPDTIFALALEQGRYEMYQTSDKMEGTAF